jgi:hypothetical protein
MKVSNNIISKRKKLSKLIKRTQNWKGHKDFGM